MKTTIFLFLFILSLAFHAQDLIDKKRITKYAFDKKQNNFSISYGGPNLYKIIVRNNMIIHRANFKGAPTQFGGAFKYSYSGYGPLFLKYEKALTNDIGLGLILGYFNSAVTQKYDYPTGLNGVYAQSGNSNYFYQSYTKRTKSFSLGIRINSHFGDSDLLDPYLGLAVGYTYAINEYSYSTNDPGVTQPAAYSEVSDDLPLYLGLTFGLRYYLTDVTGIYVEAGLDKWAILQGGIVFKLK